MGRPVLLLTSENDMFNFSTPMILSLVTILIVLGIATYQLRRVHESQAKRGEAPGSVAGPDPTDTPHR